MKSLPYASTAGTGNRCVKFDHERMRQLNNVAIDGPMIDKFMSELGLKQDHFAVTLSLRSTRKRWGTAWRKFGIEGGGRIILYRHSVSVFLHELAHLMAPYGEHHGLGFGHVAGDLFRKWEELMVDRPKPAPAVALEPVVSRLDMLKAKNKVLAKILED